MEAPDAPLEALRAKLWRALGSGSSLILKAKEMREAAAFYDCVRKDVRARAPQLVVDVCGGHGALGMMFLAHGACAQTVVVDPNPPPSHGELLAAWRPFIPSADAVIYDARPLAE